MVTDKRVGFTFLQIEVNVFRPNILHQINEKNERSVLKMVPVKLVKCRPYISGEKSHACTWSDITQVRRSKFC